MPHRGATAKQPKKPAPAATVSPVVWMGAGVLGTLLLVLGIFWMVIPDQGETYVVTNPNQGTPTANHPNPGASNGATPRTNPNQQNSNKEPQQNRNASSQQPGRPSTTSENASPANLGNARSTQTTRQQPPPAPEPRPSDPESSRASTSSTEANSPLTETASDASRPTESSNAAEESMPKPDFPGPEQPVDSSENMDGPTETAPVETVDLFVSNVIGIGADTTTHRGDTKGKSQGTKHLLIVQTRNEQDLKHIHLRFDLRSPEFKRADVQSVTLSMAFLIGQKINKTTLHVYGWEDPDAEAWREDETQNKPLLWKNSVSSGSVESLPLLATWNSDAVDVADLQRKQKFADFSSDKLTQFILDSWGRTVSFVVRGGSERGIPIRFLSKERDREFAPSLRFEVAQ
ncbi:CBM96 family carbohydrate-binding protein [Rhodopirellula sallentina]|uniref:Carbohydrate-binding module family 96 domain-containing protein n=1 Tax=Rhodopirellula sallentina SM41 TaxID=1263870 RepID=M5TS54_9BACT|nr:hypothetical protein [Rhodopirellula sallentina]EMI51990.1 hypothetical protein RSSM_06555 [Rhodopirellula sallentina SM41]